VRWFRPLRSNSVRTSDRAIDTLLEIREMPGVRTWQPITFVFEGPGWPRLDS
jgi:hypothetical protein